jgi:sugar/nucleoside kinase (ribokinase family)
VRAANPTGCGDVFNAGFVYSRLLGERIPAALRFANACAALHMRDADRPYPSAREVRAFLRRRSP